MDGWRAAESLMMIGSPVRDRRSAPEAARGLPCFSARADPTRSQWVGPAGAGGTVDLPS